MGTTFMNRKKQTFDPGLKVFAIVMAFLFTIFYWGAPVSVLNKVAWTNMVVLMSTTILLTDKRNPKARLILLIWAILSFLLMTAWILVETGQV